MKRKDFEIAQNTLITYPNSSRNTTRNTNVVWPGYKIVSGYPPDHGPSLASAFHPASHHRVAGIGKAQTERRARQAQAQRLAGEPPGCSQGSLRDCRQKLSNCARVPVARGLRVVVAVTVRAGPSTRKPRNTSTSSRGLRNSTTRRLPAAY
eukprot:1031095-Rhodomonas_salina.2